MLPTWIHYHITHSVTYLHPLTPPWDTGPPPLFIYLIVKFHIVEHICFFKHSCEKHFYQTTALMCFDMCKLEQISSYLVQCLWTCFFSEGAPHRTNPKHSFLWSLTSSKLYIHWFLISYTGFDYKCICCFYIITASHILYVLPMHNLLSLKPLRAADLWFNHQCTFSLYRMS